MTGAYLSKLQIQEISTYFSEHARSPDGIWFMIGEGKMEGKTVNTVELIPYKKADSENPMTFFKDSNGVIGGIDIHIGGRNPDSIFDFTITGNGFESVQFPPEPNVHRVPEFNEMITNPNQKTPPPFPE